MPIDVKRREGESMNAFLYRFNKKVQHSGLVKERRKRQFYTRTKNRAKRRTATLYRLTRQSGIAKARKLGRAVS